MSRRVCCCSSSSLVRGDIHPEGKNAPTFCLDLIQTSCRPCTHAHTHWLNFGRQEEEVSLMVDQAVFFKNIPAEWERRIGVWLRRTTAFKHDETGRDAAAGASSLVRLIVSIAASIKASFTMHVSPFKSPSPVCDCRARRRHTPPHRHIKQHV